jgi:hypothetical protein
MFPIPFSRKHKAWNDNVELLVAEMNRDSKKCGLDPNFSLYTSYGDLSIGGLRGQINIWQVS